MISIEQAVMMYLEKVPNKNIVGVSEWKGMYIFSGRDKSLGPDDDNWDTTLETINIQTGEFSTIGAFDDFGLVTDAKTVLTQEQVKELISSLTFD